MKIKNLLLALTACFTQMAHAVVQLNLAAPVTSKVFDRAFGTLYLGLQSGAAEKSITKVYRFDGSGTPAFSAIATNVALKDKTIEFLALSEQGCSTAPLLAAVPQAASPFEQTITYALTSDGTTVAASAELHDAINLVTQGIVGLAASDAYVFAAVIPNGPNHFGEPNSGIALMEIDKTKAKLTVLDAITGQAGNRAQVFDLNSTTLGLTPPVTFDAPVNANIQLHWDNFLSRLYLATRITAGVGGARSVAVGYIDKDGILQIKQLAPNGAFAANFVNIVGTTNATTVHAYAVRVMHASTGPSYLIVNGEVNTGTNGTNNIYALPLVDNPEVPATHGTLAKKGSGLTAGKFTEAATANAELATNADEAATVGTGPLPIPFDKIPSDIVVTGDTVYASIDDPFDATSESGIFYSQAMFDETGKIVRWTPWTKRATPFNSFPDGTTTTYPRTSFFDVDAMNGKLWAVNAVTDDAGKTLPGQKLMSTAWDFGSTSTSLAGALNTEMTTGCYSILDLDQSTLGLGVSSHARYALFGGVDKVVFALVTSASTGAPHPQQVIDDFSDQRFFLDSPLPAGAGAVVALEYSRRANGYTSENYFFAGAQGGLYVFADATTGAGFTIAATVTDLNATPFSTGKWYQIDTTEIEGSVIALKTTGQGTNGALYILTLEATDSPTQPLVSRLYSMPYHDLLQNMVSDTKLIAQSQVNAAPDSDLSKVNIILGMQTIIPVNGKEQLVIATNNGLYRSQAIEINDGILNAADQAAAKWTPVNATDTALYNGLFGIDNATYGNYPTNTTVWPVQVADEAGLKTYARGNIWQLSGKTTANGYEFVPDPFNSSDPEAANATTLPQITSFWSDGVRRFFITKRAGDFYNRNRLMVFPYDQDEWCASTLYVLDAAFNNVCACNCVKQIGATGILMVGTNSGVIALE